MKFVHEYNDYPNAKNVDGGIWEYNNGKCYNRYGGHHDYRPHPLDVFFEEDSWSDVIRIQLITNKDKYITGWISPNGGFFGCAPEDHDDVARYIFNKTQTELENAGYIKVYENPLRLRATASYNMGQYSYYCYNRPTSAQEITLERLGIKI